jgi:hypothetical protein
MNPDAETSVNKLGISRTNSYSTNHSMYKNKTTNCISE